MAVKTGKKAPIRRRRERKNIEKGSAHIQSTFIPSLRRALLRQLPRLRWSMA